MRALLGFVFGAFLPFPLIALACLAEGKSPVYAVYGVFYSLPSAILFMILAVAWEVFLSMTEPPREVEPIILEPPRRSRRGPSRPGRS